MNLCKVIQRYVLNVHKATHYGKESVTRRYLLADSKWVASVFHATNGQSKSEEVVLRITRVTYLFDID